MGAILSPFWLKHYYVFNNNGFCIPIYSKADSNTYYKAICWPPGDHEGIIASFNPINLQESLLVEVPFPRPVGLGDAWIDVFIISNKIFVGSFHELLDFEIKHRSEIASYVPLSSVDILIGSDDNYLLQAISKAIDYLDSQSRGSAKDQWLSQVVRRLVILDTMRNWLSQNNHPVENRTDCASIIHVYQYEQGSMTLRCEMSASDFRHDFGGLKLVRAVRMCELLEIDLNLLLHENVRIPFDELRNQIDQRGPRNKISITEIVLDPTVLFYIKQVSNIVSSRFDMLDFADFHHHLLDSEQDSFFRSCMSNKNYVEVANIFMYNLFIKLVLAGANPDVAELVIYKADLVTRSAIDDPLWHPDDSFTVIGMSRINDQGVVSQDGFRISERQNFSNVTHVGAIGSERSDYVNHMMQRDLLKKCSVIDISRFDNIFSQ